MVEFTEEEINTNRDTTLGIRIKTDLRDKFKHICEQKGLTQSKVITLLIQDVIKSGLKIK